MSEPVLRRWTIYERLRSADAGPRAAGPWLAAMVLLVSAFGANPALADVDLRVVARPISNPIEAFVTVTDGTGSPVSGLTAGDFTVTLDGTPISVSDFTLPPTQDPTQKVSVIFVMDYSSSVQDIARTAMETAVIEFINTMSDGDFAAIIKFNVTSGVSLVQEFTEIDHAAGTSALIAAAGLDHPGEGSPILDATNLAINHFIATLSTLPPGPKSIIVITDGEENASTVTQSGVVDNATGNSIPIFTIGVGNVSGAGNLALLTNLPDQTGGNYLPAPDDAAIADAYATISTLLGNEYLLTLPALTGADCDQHTLLVTVAGPAPGSASVTFDRCDTTPDPFSFTSQTGVTPGAVATSNSVTISGINGPAQISVTGGEYSIGCGSASFRSTDSMISNSDTVCVRHTASSAFSTDRVTTLVVGGVSGEFTSRTKAAPPPKGGGGGATGVFELLLGLAAMAARRRLHA